MWTDDNDEWYDYHCYFDGDWFDAELYEHLNGLNLRLLILTNNLWTQCF